MIWLSFAVFAVSMFLPMHYMCVPDDNFDYYSTKAFLELGRNNDSAYLYTGRYLVNVLLMPLSVLCILIQGTVSNGFPSMSNIIYLTVLCGLWRNRDTARLIKWTCLLIGIAILFYLNHSLVAFPVSYYYDSYFITTKGPGYFLWLSSLIILLGAEIYEAKHCPNRRIVVYPTNNIEDRKNKNGMLFANILVAFGLLAFISSMFFPMCSLEAHRLPEGSEDEYLKAEALSGTYVCGKAFLSGILSLPKDIARLTVAGGIHFRLLMTFINVLLLTCMYLVHKHRAGRKIHVAMLVAVIYIVGFCQWNYQELLNWAWDWTPALSVSEKYAGYYLWLSSFVLVYVAVAYQRFQVYRLKWKRRVVRPEDKAKRRRAIVLFAICALIAFPLLYYILVIIACALVMYSWGAL